MRVYYENIAYHNIINILFFKHLIIILIILRVPYSVGFPNTTYNVIKSQINKRNILFYIIFIFVSLRCWVQRSNIIPKEPQHQKMFGATTPQKIQSFNITNLKGLILTITLSQNKKVTLISTPFLS